MIDGINKKLLFGVLIIIVLLTIVAGLKMLKTPTKPAPTITPLSLDMSCDEIYSEIKNDLNKANYCQKDSDCDVIEFAGVFAMKFGCFSLVNKSVDQGKIYQKLDAYYKKECLPKGEVAIRCAPTPDVIKCVSGRCVPVYGKFEQTESYISCGCGCCAFDKPLEEIAKVECLYRSKGENIQDKIDQDRQLSPQLCAAAGCSFPIKYIYCD